MSSSASRGFAALALAAGREGSVERPTTAALFHAHAEFVLRVARRLGVADAEVEDVAQEVFVQVHHALERLLPGVEPRSWLYGIVRRVVANHRRKTRRRYDLHAQLEQEGGANAVGDAGERLDARRLLDHVLELLDLEKREVFVLFELEQLPMREVALLVGCPIKTAYSRLAAARVIVQAGVAAAQRARRSS